MVLLVDVLPSLVEWGFEMDAWRSGWLAFVKQIELRISNWFSADIIKPTAAATHHRFHAHTHTHTHTHCSQPKLHQACYAAMVCLEAWPILHFLAFSLVGYSPSPAPYAQELMMAATEAKEETKRRSPGSSPVFSKSRRSFVPLCVGRLVDAQPNPILVHQPASSSSPATPPCLRSVGPYRINHSVVCREHSQTIYLFPLPFPTRTNHLSGIIGAKGWPTSFSAAQYTISCLASQYEPRAPNAATSRCAILPMFRGKEETGGQDSE
ncbi:hypothetical protein A9K55_003580 [Cordyceps militaris]|uniref:Uncharacterized protein n=1 Tax=Cordyceps militaris TaxID=73501 RepID=A0A2H4S840_CORMI|nr:hypothetical protein A9K55_003580 [Cordyceps militaris]